MPLAELHPVAQVMFVVMGGLVAIVVLGIISLKL